MHTARRTAPLTDYVTPEMSAALRARAANDDRTLSSEAARILRAALTPSTSSNVATNRAQTADRA